MDIDTITQINAEEEKITKEGAYTETPAQELARLRNELVDQMQRPTWVVNGLTEEDLVF